MPRPKTVAVELASSRRPTSSASSAACMPEPTTTAWMPEPTTTATSSAVPMSSAAAWATRGPRGPGGEGVEPVRPIRDEKFLHHMLADDASPTSLRSYAYELLAWVRLLHAVGVPWHLASRVEARDFALWLKTTKKPPRQRHPDAPVPGSVNPVMGKATPGENYGDPLVLRVPPRGSRPAAGHPVPAGRGCR
jgi:hypothetical protein